MANTNYPTEPKVKAATVAAVVAGFVLWLLSTYVFHGNIPDAVSAVIVVAVTAGLTWGAGYVARHQYRGTDVGEPPKIQN